MLRWRTRQRVVWECRIDWQRGRDRLGWQRRSGWQCRIDSEYKSGEQGLQRRIGCQCRIGWLGGGDCTGWTGPQTRWSPRHRGRGGLTQGRWRRAPARPWCRAESCTRTGCRRTSRPEGPAAVAGRGGSGVSGAIRGTHAVDSEASGTAYQLLHLLLGRQHRRDARLEAHRRRRLVRHSGGLRLHSDDAHGCIRPALRRQERSALLQ